MRISVNTLDLKSPSFSPANYAIAARRIAQRSGKIGVLVHPGYAGSYIYGSRPERNAYFCRLTGFKGDFRDYQLYLEATNYWLKRDQPAVLVINDTDLRLPEAARVKMEDSGALLIEVDSLQTGSPRPRLASDEGAFFPLRWRSLRRIVKELGGRELLFAGEFFRQPYPWNGQTEAYGEVMKTGLDFFFKPTDNIFCLDAAIVGLLGFFDHGLTGRIYYPATFPGIVSPLNGKRLVFEGAYDQ